MPSCQKRTATPAEMLEPGARQGEGRGEGTTEAGPEKDFVNHCDDVWDWFSFTELGEVRKMGIRGGHSLEKFQRCLNRRGLCLCSLQIELVLCDLCDAVWAAILCRA